MATIVTVKEVAQRAEVSVGTVSRVFNNHSNVTDKMRQRVLKAAAELGYSGSAGHLSRAAANANSFGHEAFAHGNGKAMKEIGFLFCYPMKVEASEVTTNPVWSRVLKGAANAASRANMKVTFWAIDDLLSTPEHLFSALVERQLDGVLLVGTVEPEIIRLIQRSKIPLVLIDNVLPGLSVDAVLNDGFGGAQEAVTYLINEGHRRIAFLSGPTHQGIHPVNVFYTIERRAAGYRAALLEAGIPVDYDLFEASDSVTVEGGYQACKRLVERGAQFSALFCANDFVAIGAMKALREAGLRIPEDVSLVGYDNVDMAEHLFPPLTTVHSDIEAVGYVAVRNLLLRLTDPEACAITILLESRLVKRASVIPYRSA